MKPLRVLLSEDSEDDVKLIAIELRRAGYEVTLRCVDTAETLDAALGEASWDVILADYTLPRLDARTVLARVQASHQSDVPVIIVSGSIGEESAVEALKAGAVDFIVKTNLARLAPAIERELREAQVRRERREALEALRLAVKARDEFLSIASHELKTPLATLMLQVEGMLRLLRGHPEGRPLDVARVMPRLDTIDRSAHRLMQLIDRLLDITRLTSGRLALELAEVELASLVREALDRLADPLRESGSELAFSGGGPVVGRWDRERLDAVITNLLTNAIKYGEGKPIEVRVEDDGERARVVVADQGIGIPEADQRRIFERFERAVPERHFGGFGIGLWLSHQIVEAHAGRIVVRSAPGAGSTFVVELPKKGPAHEA